MVPFFSDFERRHNDIISRPEEALEEYAAREPFEYQKRLYRAFLNLSLEECDKMGPEEYNINYVMLKHVMKLWHAPFQGHS